MEWTQPNIVLALLFQFNITGNELNNVNFVVKFIDYFSYIFHQI